MALIKIRNRWVNFAVPRVVAAVMFAGALVGWFGDSVGYAMGYSLAFGATLAVLDSLHRRRRDAKRRRHQQGMNRPGFLGAS
jgi:hypothetical protein